MTDEHEPCSSLLVSRFRKSLRCTHHLLNCYLSVDQEAQAFMWNPPHLGEPLIPVSRVSYRPGNLGDEQIVFDSNYQR